MGDREKGFLTGVFTISAIWLVWFASMWNAEQWPVVLGLAGVCAMAALYFDQFRL